MNLSTILKGAAVAATFAFFASEASAQLPVRTRSLQLLGSTSGSLTHQAAGTTTPYTLTWPNAGVTTGNSGILRSDDAGVMTWTLFPAGEDIVTVTGGAFGQVAYFSDPNTITSSPNFTFAGSTVTLGDATTAGGVAISDGSSNTGTFQTAALGANQTYTLPDASGNVPVSTNTPTSGTTGYVAVSNGDGTFTWVVNPTSGLQRGTETPTPGTFTHVVAVTGTPDFTNDVILVSTSNSGASGNILQVTAVAAGSFTVSSTAPFDANDRISWVFIPIP